MRAFKVCTAILFALAVVRLAHAQDEVKRSETEFYVQTSDGAAEVCGLDYTIMYVDRRNLAGIRGQLAWMERNGTFAAALAIKGFDLNAQTPIPFPVFRGFVVIDGKSVLPSLTLKADQPTDFVGGYSFEDAVAITYAINGKKRLAVGFNREADGGKDTILPINITPSSNLGAFMDFADCLITLADRAKANGPNR
jgi:hypothetical protein